MSLRRQKRWWNAYILMYEREDGYQSFVVDELTKSIEDLTLGENLTINICITRLTGVTPGDASILMQGIIANS